MTVRNFPSDTGITPTGSFNDTAPLNLGTVFGLTAVANITGVRFYAPATTTVTVQLWVDGTKVAETIGATATGPGWTTITFSSPVVGNTSSTYIASVYWATGSSAYAARTNTFSDGTNPVLVTVGPVFSNNTSNGLYTYGAGIPATPSGVNGMWFGVDAVVDDLSGGGSVAGVRATGTASAPVPVVSNGGSTVAAVRAQATGVAPAPSIAGSANGGLTAVRATATAAGRAPTVGINGSVAAVPAIGAATVPIPAVDVVVTLTGGGAAAGTAAARPPTVGSVSNGTVTGVPAVVTAAAGIPTVTGQVLGSGAAVRATGTATALAPVVTGTTIASPTVNAVRATATATSTAPGVILAETLPSNVGTGRITGRFAEAKVLIGDADGIPNLYPFTTETVTFTSTAPILLDTTATPAPVVIIPRPIVCTLDSLGYLVDSAGHQYVDLIATNDPDLTPTTRKWRAVFSAGLGIATFDFVVLSGATKDLTAEIPT